MVVSEGGIIKYKTSCQQNINRPGAVKIRLGGLI